MNSNAAHTRRFSYAVLHERGGSPARHMVKILMATLMSLGMATSAQASIEQVAPNSGACFSSSQNTGCSPSVQFAANSACGTVGGGSATNITRIDLTTWRAECQLTVHIFRIIGSVTCPVPTVNSTVLYSYNANTSMCEREQQVLYTITLHNLGGEINTSASRAAYAQVMEGATAKSGIAVTLTTTAPPEAGTAILSPTAGSTGGDGRLNFSFTAPPVGGTHTVTATCDGGKCSNQTTETIVVTACKIPPLTPMTDPVAIDFDNNVRSRWRPNGLTGDYSAKLKCVQDGIDLATGTLGSYTGTSAYRPFQYQQHLFEIVQKDRELNPRYMFAHPECQARRDEITRKMGPEPQGHALKPRQKVATPGKSRHESGTAFDLTPIGLSKTQMAPIYAGCGVTNTKVRGEPWHVK